jgi:ABC-type transporter MlaC component
MYKEKMERQLNNIWQTWLVAEETKNRLRFEYEAKFLTKFDADYNTEMFLSNYYDKLTETQKEFANNILQTMVEIQNHDNIPNE